MNLGEPIEVIEVVPEPSVPYQGEEVSPDYKPEDAPSETPQEIEVEVGG